MAALDPPHSREDAVVSHGHMDHLSSGAVMTPETLDVLKVRRPRGTGTPVPYHRATEVGGFDVEFRPAGHTFGSAMIRVNDLLYTGDFNPEGGETCGKATPEPCEDLVIDATYGRPDLNFPPKDEVVTDLLSWTEAALEDGPVAVGGYEFGKGQELIALFNRLKVEVAVSDRIADLADVCAAHGIPLRYRRLSEITATERRDPRVYVLPTNWVRDPMPEPVAWIREHGAEHGADPDFLVVTGGSAGGHLAALVALSANDPEYQPGFEGVDTSVRGCVSFYGVYDFTDRYQLHRHDGLAKLLERRVMKAALREASQA